MRSAITALTAARTARRDTVVLRLLLRIGGQISFSLMAQVYLYRSYTDRMASFRISRCVK